MGEEENRMKVEGGADAEERLTHVLAPIFRKMLEADDFVDKLVEEAEESRIDIGEEYGLFLEVVIHDIKGCFNRKIVKTKMAEGISQKDYDDLEGSSWEVGHFIASIRNKYSDIDQIYHKVVEEAWKRFQEKR